MAVEGSGSLLALFIRPGRDFYHDYDAPQIRDRSTRRLRQPKFTGAKPTGPYEIVRVLPMEDGSWRSYRIKSVGEPFERIAKEYEIAAIDREKAAETA